MSRLSRLKGDRSFREQERLFDRWFGSDEGLFNFVFEACKTADAVGTGEDVVARVPRRPALELVLQRCLEEPILPIIGSRKVLKSWVPGYCYALWRVMKDRYRNVALVQQKLQDGEAHVDRRIRNALWHNLPQWLKDRFALRGANGLFHLTHLGDEVWDSHITPYPQGANQLRYDTFSLILADEFHEMSGAEEFYQATIPTILGSGKAVSQFIAIFNADQGSYAEKLLGPGRYRLIEAAGGAPVSA